MKTSARQLALWLVALTALVPSAAHAQIVVYADALYTMAGPGIRNGVVVIENGRIAAVGPASEIAVPNGYRVLRAAVVTPGLIDAHATVGLTGIYNQPHDQDQIERSGPIQPELRALDAYNTREQLIEWVRSFGVTTIHTGHAPGELISGQTMVVKTVGNTVEAAMLVETAAIAATLGPGARRSSGSPGTRGKMMSMLRSELIKAQEYLDGREPKAEEDTEHAVDEEAADDADADDSDAVQPRTKSESSASQPRGSRNLRLEAIGRVLKRELPLLITAHKSQDIASALRLAREFNIRIILDGAAEAYLLIDEIRDAGVPVIIHPSMARMYGEMENASFETAVRLRTHGIQVAMQSGFEGYVPKTRVVLFETAVYVAHGFAFEDALAAMTRVPATMLGIIDRVGTLEVGKDADLALYSGDPFEYTTHCIGVIINGEVVSEKAR